MVRFPIYTRQGALDFFKELFPPNILNCRNIPEETLTYLLRHFQILPRQLVMLFNSILSTTIKSGGSFGEIEGEIVVKSIHEQESNMADEIIQAYESMYPEAREIRKKVLPNIPLVFQYKDIRRYYDGKEYVNTGKKILSSMKNKVEVSPYRFERCLIETGMVGRVMGSQDPHGKSYINAEFEYAMPGTLDLCENDYLVIHPIFSGQQIRTGLKKFANPNVIGVYPHEADPMNNPDRAYMRDQFVPCS